jgi:hypothetical protein
MRRQRADRLVGDIGAGRHGIVGGADARRAGLDDMDLDRLRRYGTLIPLGRGVDRLRDHPFDWASRCHAALALAGPDAVLGPRPSARHHGFYSYRRCDDVEVNVRRGRDHRTALGRVLQTRWLPPSHVTVVDGTPVLTLGRTFFGLCADPDPGLAYRHPYHRRKMRRVYNDAIGRRGLTFTQEAAVLAVTARRGRRGTTLVRSILLEFPPKHQPTKSDAEFLFLELLTAYGLPPHVRQLPISGDDGFIGVVDFAWPDARLVVEIDSRWHDGPLDELEDLERDRRLEAAGWTVHRYRYPELIARPTAIAHELGAAAHHIG